MFKFIKKLFNSENKFLDQMGVLYGEDAKIFLEKMEENNKNIGNERPEKKNFDFTIADRIIDKSRNKPFVNKNH